jgi:predicted RNA-binding protein YlqC (UPF0109 family)
MGDMPKDQEFLQYVLSILVDEPDKLEIERRLDDLGVLLTVRCSKNDMGKIIGKSGQTAKSIRVLLRIIGAKTNERVNMKILDSDFLDEDLGI